MSEPTPHMAAILAQVEAEINTILAAGETGQIVIHCGPNDIAVEVTRKRKREPVRINRPTVEIVER